MPSRRRPALNAESVPAPTALGWSKAAIKSILRRDICLGRVTFGKTRNDAKGGVAERCGAVDQKDWFVVQNDGLRIISDELWRRGRATSAGDQSDVRPQSAAGPATRASRVRARLEALDERCRPMLRVRRPSDLRSPGREARAPLLWQSQTRDGALQERTRHIEERHSTTQYGYGSTRCSRKTKSYIGTCSTSASRSGRRTPRGRLRVSRTLRRNWPGSTAKSNGWSLRSPPGVRVRPSLVRSRSVSQRSKR